MSLDQPSTPTTTYSGASESRLDCTMKTSRLKGYTLIAIKQALEGDGIEFIGDPDNSPGVRLNIK